MIRNGHAGFGRGVSEKDHKAPRRGPTSADPSQANKRPRCLMTDRVSERRRAAQLARHYRDQEGLTIAEIARRLRRAPATVKAYL